MSYRPELSSFRDRDGFIFYSGDKVFRAIRLSYSKTWEALQKTTFFNALVKEGKTVAWEESVTQPDSQEEFCKVISVEKIPFVSYPSEWTCAQLRVAALLTLEIQERALNEGFTLKDASAFNVQFVGSRAVFIDTLSFEPYVEGEPWHAYGQFCRHFLGPLLLEKYGLGALRSQLSQAHDGIPLQICSSLLPARSRLNLSASLHIHLHAKFERRHSHSKLPSSSALKTTVSRTRALISQLKDVVTKIKSAAAASHWLPYYDTFSYSPGSFEAKKNFVTKQLAAGNYGLCADLGANTGEFSILAAQHCSYVVACDSDPAVIEAINNSSPQKILALQVDLLNPTPSFGWDSKERTAFTKRLISADVVLALALVHHLCLGNNLPLSRLAEFFAALEADLIIEFVPRTDPQAEKLLVSRKNIFVDYTIEKFRLTFSKYFAVMDESALPGTERHIFMFKHLKK